MKKMIRMVAMAILIMGMPQVANAQLKNILKSTASTMASNALSNATGSSTTGTVVTSLLSNLLGTSTVSESSLEGTWTYTGPGVVLESDNVLSNVAGSVITSNIEKKEKKLLEKAGIKAGKVVLQLNSDKSAVITVGSKKVNATWSVSGSDLTLTILTRSIKMNTQLSGNEMQLAMSADKMLTLVSAVGTSASNISSSFSTITSLLNKYKGLYLGLKFSK